MSLTERGRGVFQNTAATADWKSIGGGAGGCPGSSDTLQQHPLPEHELGSTPTNPVPTTTAGAIQERLLLQRLGILQL